MGVVLFYIMHRRGSILHHARAWFYFTSVHGRGSILHQCSAYMLNFTNLPNDILPLEV